MAKQRVRSIAFVAWAVLTAIFTPFATAQVLHHSGQAVQPVFEGFEQHADGSFSLWFGYLNRNYEERPDIAIGSDNQFLVADGVDRPGPVDPELILDETAPIDRGQPTYFYPRRQQFVFSVRVPEDFAGKELVWSLSHNGETNIAVGTLEQANIWHVDEGVWSANRGRGIGGRTDVEYANLPPSVRIMGVEGPLTVQLGQPLSLRAFATDDGLPGAYGGRRRQLDPLPNALPEIGGRVGDNSPKTQSVVNYVAADETGLALTWIKYRGSGDVEFDTAVSTLNPAGEESVTSVEFSQRGTYVLRAYADDGNFTRSVDVTVVVQ